MNVYSDDAAHELRGVPSTKGKPDAPYNPYVFAPIVL